MTMFTIFIPNVYFRIAKIEREQLFLSCLFVCLFFLKKKGEEEEKEKEKKKKLFPSIIVTVTTTKM